MKLSELKELAEYLLGEGVSPDTPLCLFDGEGVKEIVADGDLMVGTYQDDPSPKMRGALAHNGKFILLQGYDQDVPERVRRLIVD